MAHASSYINTSSTSSSSSLDKKQKKDVDIFLYNIHCTSNGITEDFGSSPDKISLIGNVYFPNKNRKNVIALPSKSKGVEEGQNKVDNVHQRLDRDEQHHHHNNNIITDKRRIIINVTNIPREWYVYPADSTALDELLRIFDASSDNNSHHIDKPTLSLIRANLLPTAFAYNKNQYDATTYWLRISSIRNIHQHFHMAKIHSIQDLKTFLINNTSYYKSIKSDTIRIISPDKNIYDTWVKKVSAQGLSVLPGWFRLEWEDSGDPNNNNGVIATAPLNKIHSLFKLKQGDDSNEDGDDDNNNNTSTPVIPSDVIHLTITLNQLIKNATGDCHHYKPFRLIPSTNKDLPFPFLTFLWLDLNNRSYAVTNDSSYGSSHIFPGDEGDIQRLTRRMETATKGRDHGGSTKGFSLQRKDDWILGGSLNKIENSIVSNNESIVDRGNVGKYCIDMGTLIRFIVASKARNRHVDIDCIVYIVPGYPVIQNSHETNIFDLHMRQVEHVLGWQSHRHGNQKFHAHASTHPRPRPPPNWRQMIHFIHEQKTASASISTEMRKMILCSEKSRLSTSVFEARIAHAPWQITCGYTNHQTKKVSWFLMGLLSQSGFQILPTESCLVDPSFPKERFNVKYKGGFIKMKSQGGLYSDQDHFIMGFDCNSYYPRIAVEYDLCMTESIRDGGMWSRYFSFLDSGSGNVNIQDIADSIIPNLLERHLENQKITANGRLDVNKNNTLSSGTNSNHKSTHCTRPLSNKINQLLELRNYAKGVDVLTPLSSALKLLLNSTYGTFAHENSPLFAPLLSAVIANLGRSLIQEASSVIENLIPGCKTLLYVTDCIICRIPVKSEVSKLSTLTQVTRKDASNTAAAAAKKTLLTLSRHDVNTIIKPFLSWVQTRFYNMQIDSTNVFNSILIVTNSQFAALKSPLMFPNGGGGGGGREEDATNPVDLTSQKHIDPNKIDTFLVVKGLECKRSDWSSWASNIIKRTLFHILSTRLDTETTKIHFDSLLDHIRTGCDNWNPPVFSSGSEAKQELSTYSIKFSPGNAVRRSIKADELTCSVSCSGKYHTESAYTGVIVSNSSSSNSNVSEYHHHHHDSFSYMDDYGGGSRSNSSDGATTPSNDYSTPSYMRWMLTNTASSIDADAWQYWYLGEQVFKPIFKRLLPAIASRIDGMNLDVNNNVDITSEIKMAECISYQLPLDKKKNATVQRENRQNANVNVVSSPIGSDRMGRLLLKSDLLKLIRVRDSRMREQRGTEQKDNNNDNATVDNINKNNASRHTTAHSYWSFQVQCAFCQKYNDLIEMYKRHRLSLSNDQSRYNRIPLRTSTGGSGSNSSSGGSAASFTSSHDVGSFISNSNMSTSTMDGSLTTPTFADPYHAIWDLICLECKRTVLCPPAAPPPQTDSTLSSSSKNTRDEMTVVMDEDAMDVDQFDKISQKQPLIVTRAMTSKPTFNILRIDKTDNLSNDTTTSIWLEDRMAYLQNQKILAVLQTKLNCHRDTKINNNNSMSSFLDQATMADAIVHVNEQIIAEWRNNLIKQSYDKLYHL